MSGTARFTVGETTYHRTGQRLRLSRRLQSAPPARFRHAFLLLHGGADPASVTGFAELFTPGPEGRQHLFSYRESRQKARNHRQNSHGVSRRHHPAADSASARHHGT